MRVLRHHASSKTDGGTAKRDAAAQAIRGILLPVPPAGWDHHLQTMHEALIPGIEQEVLAVVVAAHTRRVVVVRTHHKIPKTNTRL